MVLPCTPRWMRFVLNRVSTLRFYRVSMGSVLGGYVLGPVLAGFAGCDLSGFSRVKESSPFGSEVFTSCRFSQSA